MFDEMHFLFDNSSNVYTSKVNVDILTAIKRNGRTEVVHRSDMETNKMNYIKNSVNASYSDPNNSKINPYTKILADFNAINHVSAEIKASDLVYLRDIGVYPINRMFVLRRFPDNAYVANDLDKMKTKPIATIVGWMKDDKEFLKFGFGEKWVEQGSDKMLHKLLTEIMDNEFGIKMNQILPVPGWGLGFMFGVMHNMGLTDYTSTHLPIGDPNLLQESLTRDGESFGLKSSFNFNLETVYEQKFINGVDPTFQVNDILERLTAMGTSNVRYFGTGNSQFIKDLINANNNPTDVAFWVKLIGHFIEGFTQALAGVTDNIFDAFTSLKASAPKTNNTTTTNTTTVAPSGAAQGKSTNKSNLLTGALKGVGDFFTTNKDNWLIQSVLASTAARYVWPLRGSIAMFTGQPSTPWHLTIGNPYAPLLSMANVYVKNIDVAFTGDMMFNDIPKFMNVSIQVEQARNMGKQEITKMFNIKYKREYTPLKSSDYSPKPSSSNTTEVPIPSDLLFEKEIPFSSSNPDQDN
jgi:hypothetical protein